MCAGGSQQHYSVDNEPVWQPQYGSSVRGHPSMNGSSRYADDVYGPDLDASGQFDLEPSFTQQQVNGMSSFDLYLKFRQWPWWRALLSLQYIEDYWKQSWLVASFVHTTDFSMSVLCTLHKLNLNEELWRMHRKSYLHSASPSSLSYLYKTFLRITIHPGDLGHYLLFSFSKQHSISNLYLRITGLHCMCSICLELFQT